RESFGLEFEPNAAIDHTAIDWRPLVNGPLPVKASRGSQQRIVLRLPNVRKIFSVHKEPHRSETPFHEDAKQPIWNIAAPIRVIIECLHTRIKGFNSNSPPCFLSHVPTMPTVCFGFNCYSCRS